MAQDRLQKAKEDYADCKDHVSEQYERIREDFRFSNPAAPEQWDCGVVKNRAGRPMHTLDRTNQFVQHVVNNLREAKTSADVLPEDSNADIDVAKVIKGMFRHIEYISRADIAWDTAVDHQARGGLGWVRVIPKLMDPRTNEQDIMVLRVNDPTSCLLDPNSTEPDGSDAMMGFCETAYTEKAFKAAWPKAATVSFDTDGWFAEDSIRVVEHFHVKETAKNNIVIVDPDGAQMTLGEDEYWALAKQIGYQPQVLSTFVGKKRAVTWSKLSGAEILEETVYPSQWIGLVPVLGHELWVDGKRYLCGLVRRLMDGQRLHNFEMSALTESLMVQPKAPFLVPARALEGYEDDWKRLNSGNPSYLPYNDLDDEGNPIAQPSRLAPPNFPIAYANAADMAVREMEASVGMHPSVFGQKTNSISGRAKLADQAAGNIATFHFADNKRVAQQHVYRIILDMMPTIYSGSRQARIMGEDGQQSSMQINPNLQQAGQRQGGKLVAINPSVGRYGVHLKVGPSYSTLNEEMGIRLQELGKGNPVLAAALTPIMMEMSGMPQADRIARVAIAMLPPEVQKAYHEEETSDMPPAAKAQIGEQGKQIEQMASAMDQAGKVIQDLQEQVNAKNDVVKAEAKGAMGEIKAAQQDLAAQSAALDAQKRELMDTKKIVSLEMQIDELKRQQTAHQDEMMSEQAKGKEQATTQTAGNDALAELARIIEQGQTAVAKALEQNVKAMAQLQNLTVSALGDLAEVAGASREITLKKAPDGTTIGATSTVVMPESETLQ